MRKAVVLPQPLGPISDTISPACTVKLTRRSAGTTWVSPPTRSVKSFELVEEAHLTHPHLP